MFSLYYYYHVNYTMYSYNTNHYICTAIVIHIYSIDALYLDHYMILAGHA